MPIIFPHCLPSYVLLRDRRKTVCVNLSTCEEGRGGHSIGKGQLTVWGVIEEGLEKGLGRSWNVLSSMVLGAHPWVGNRERRTTYFLPLSVPQQLL